MVDTAAALTGSSRNLLATAKLSQDVDQNENPIAGAFEVEDSSNPGQLSSVKRTISLGGTGTIVDDIGDVGGSPDPDFVIADDDTAESDMVGFQADTPTPSTTPDDGAEPMIARDNPSES